MQGRSHCRLKGHGTWHVLGATVGACNSRTMLGHAYGICGGGLDLDEAKLHSATMISSSASLTTSSRVCHDVKIHTLRTS